MNLFPSGKAQVPLLQPLCYLGNFPQGGGDPLFQVGGKDHDADQDGGKADGRGNDYRKKGLAVGLGAGDTSEDNAVNLSIGIFCGDVGTKVFFVLDGSFAHIVLALAQDQGVQIGGQLGTHHPLAVLNQGGVSADVPLVNCEFAAHPVFQLIQQLGRVLSLLQALQLIGQHIGAVDAAVPQHSGNQRTEDNDAESH